MSYDQSVRADQKTGGCKEPSMGESELGGACIWQDGATTCTRWAAPPLIRPVTRRPPQLHPTALQYHLWPPRGGQVAWQQRRPSQEGGHRRRPRRPAHNLPGVSGPQLSHPARGGISSRRCSRHGFGSKLLTWSTRPSRELASRASYRASKPAFRPDRRAC